MAGPSTGLPAADADQVPAAATSPLSSLRARRQQVVEKLFVDLPVPRYDPPVFVRFAPLADGRMAAINKQYESSKDKEKNVVANAVALADACLGVFEVDEDDEPVSIDDADRSHTPGDWPKFDARLGALLGMEAGGPMKAADVVRRLYCTDGDIVATASKVAEWSGYTMQGMEEREGN